MTPTPTQTATPTPTVTATATPDHDVGKAGGGFSTSGRATGTSAGPVIKAVKIKVKNFGTIAETDVPFTVTSSCSDATDGCGPNAPVYSAECTGNAAALSGDGDLDPGEVVSVSGCTVTYSGPLTGSSDIYTHVLMITHCGTDGTSPPCTSDHGGTDSNPSNNTAIKNTKVLP